MQLNVHPFKSIEEAREWARNQIDEAAGAARARYITVTPGQDATYQAKYADAQAFVRAGYPDADISQYPWVKAEADATGLSFALAADSIKAVGDPWNLVVGPAIESLRIGGKSALNGILSIGGVAYHVSLVREKLDLA
jgi:hypothetical protein